MKKALIVIDMQNDYLWEKRKKKFSYDTDTLVNSVNALIDEYNNDNCDVIYVRQVIQNTPLNGLLFGYSLQGTEGAELYPKLNVVSQYCFDKSISDAFSNNDFLNLVKEKEYEVLHLCGLDECGCVAATALGAVGRGFKAEIIRNATATAFKEKKVQQMHELLNMKGIKYI